MLKEKCYDCEAIYVERFIQPNVPKFDFTITKRKCLEFKFIRRSFY